MLDSAFIDSLQIHSTTQYALLNVTGLGSPQARANRSDKAQRHGQLDFTKFYGPRVIGLTGVVIGSSLLNAWTLFDALKASLALGTSHTFRFLRSGLTDQEQCAFTVDSTVDAPLTIPIPVIQWGVTLVAADPRMYSATLRSASYDPTLAGAGGVNMPMIVVGGLVFSSTTATRLVVTNLGQFQTPVTLAIKGPVNNPIVDNDSIGLSIGILYNLGSNDTVTIDTGNRTVLLNGVSRPDLLDAANTVWYNLTPGQNNLRLRGTGMVTAQTLLTASFRDARI